jgi:hypothetical protein
MRQERVVLRRAPLGQRELDAPQVQRRPGIVDDPARRAQVAHLGRQLAVRERQQSQRDTQ